MHFEERTYKVVDIARVWRNGQLQRNEEYQRGETWTPQQKQALIDSLMRGYPIPSLFFQEKVEHDLDGNASKKYEVVDGQQRIVALADFLADKYELLEPADKRLRLPLSMRREPISWAKRRYTQLDPSDRERLDNIDLRAYVIDGVEQQDQIRDLFIRLQSGTALTRQQIRDAWPGTMGPFVEAIAGKLNRRPSTDVFDFIDARGTRDDEGDSKDPYVKQRTTCAQMLTILLARMSDPMRVPAIGAPELDASYHEYTDFDVHGESSKRIIEVIGHCDRVCKQIDKKTWGKRKMPKVGLFALAMFFQDALKSPYVKFTDRSYQVLATFITDKAPKPPSRTVNGGAIKKYYDEWREALPIGVGIELDEIRLFDGPQKQQIFDRQAGICAICQERVQEGDAEYDHYPIPYRDGGRTNIDNGRLVHAICHPRGRPIASSSS